MSDLNSFAKRNSATAANPFVVNDRTVEIHQTVRGSDFYYAWCAVMGATAIGILAASKMKPRTDRIFFYLSAALTFTACIAYFSMGTNVGWAPIDVEWQRSDPKVAGRNRQVFYARYIDWFITTPLLLTDLLLTAGFPWPTILWIIFLDEVMIITGLIGALVRSSYKFGFFAFGCAAMLYIFYELGVVGTRHARRLGADVGRVYFTCGVLTLFVWLLYPICWGLAEGGNIISPDSEAVFYGVLDFLAKPVFSVALLFGHWNIDPGRLGLKIREAGHPEHDTMSSEKRHDPERSRPTPGAAPVNGTLVTHGTLATSGAGNSATH